MFEAAPYRPPLDLEEVAEKAYTFCAILVVILYVLCLLGVLVWGFLAARYLVLPFPETPINPIRHETAAILFTLSMMAAAFWFFVAIPCMLHSRSLWALPCIWCAFVLGFTIVITVASASDAFK